MTIGDISRSMLPLCTVCRRLDGRKLTLLSLPWLTVPEYALPKGSHSRYQLGKISVGRRVHSLFSFLSTSTQVVNWTLRMSNYRQSMS